MLAEQIATLETNYADAQAKITAQDSSIETLTVSVAALTKDKLLLEAGLADSQKRVADLEAHNDETMAAVESLAKSALDMLRIAQRPPGMPAAIVQFAPKRTLAAALATKDDPSAQMTETEVAAAREQLAAMRFEAVQQGVAEALADDTGDETSTAVEHETQPIAPITTNDTPAASDDAMNRIHSTALPDNVMKADGPLPVFLQRDTVLQREGVNVLG